MQDANFKQYSYIEAGFNGFFSRSIGGNAQAKTLSSLSYGRTSGLNFDQTQVSGSLGDVIPVGLVKIDGREGRIDIQDESGNVIARFGREDS